MYEARQHKTNVFRTLSRPKHKSMQQFVLLPIPHTLQMMGHVAQFGGGNRPKGTHKNTNKEKTSFVSEDFPEICRRFVLKEDAEKIAQYTIDKNCAISIRETGEASLARLRDGAGTKPHSILDKSLKAKTAPLIADGRKLEYKDSTDALKKILDELKLPKDMVGHVPHWDGTNSIDGFYLTSKGCKKGDNSKIFPKNRNENRYLTIQGCKKLINNLIKKNKPWHDCFLTGDYDVHDIMKFSKFNRRGQDGFNGNYPRIPKASDIHSYEKTGDTGMLRDLNEIMGYDEDRQRFQHGAQVNYADFANMSGEAVVRSLLQPDFPIALCDRGQWSIIESEVMLRDWYSGKCLYPW